MGISKRLAIYDAISGEKVFNNHGCSPFCSLNGIVAKPVKIRLVAIMRMTKAAKVLQLLIRDLSQFLNSNLIKLSLESIDTLIHKVARKRNGIRTAVNFIENAMPAKIDPRANVLYDRLEM